MLLAPHIGKARAQALLESLARQTGAARPLLPLVQQAIAADAELATGVDPGALRAAFDADAAARQASAVATPQWAALRTQAAALNAQPLPTSA
jgi:hypothetical protein